MKKSISLTLALLFIFLFNSAPVRTQVNDDQRFPALVFPDRDRNILIPMKMTALSVSVKVIGNLAVTTMDMSFYNDNNRIMEGDFYFPLGEGQTVSRFAMDVNGKLREAVVVEKEKGRQIFEKVVREGSDPGLLEWTKGNNFKARIYPIPAKGYKRVVIAYEQELSDDSKGYLYSLPLAFKDRIKEFSVKIEVFKQEIKPETNENELQGIEFNKWNDSYIAEKIYQEFTPDKTLKFKIPRFDANPRIFVEPIPNQINKYYFYANIPVEKMSQQKELPHNLCILWDASGSGAKRDIEKEIALLTEYLKKIANANINLVFFANDIISEQTLNINSGNLDNLIKIIKSVKYDGGTQIGCLDLTKYKADEVILFSDGLSNFGKSEAKIGDAPIITVNSSSIADHSYLNFLAQSGGGIYLNLISLSQNQALEAISNQAYSFISAEFDNNTINETYPSIPTLVNKNLGFAGIMTGETAEIKLNFGFGKTIKKTHTIVIDKNKFLVDLNLIKRIWGQKKIYQLDMNFKKNESAITQLGKDLSIVTRNTSLLILDRLEDYIRFKVMPPEEEMRAQYTDAINNQQKADSEKQKSHIDEVATKFQQRVSWWEKEFPKGVPYKQPEDKKSGEASPRPAGAENDDGSADDALSPRSSNHAEAPMAAKKAKDSKGESPEGSITLTKWDPKTPYLEEIKSKSDEKMWDCYLEQKAKYANSSAFFLDMADFFNEKNKKDLTLRILSNIAEMELENPQLLRILGYRLMQLGYYKLSVLVFEEVRKMRPEEPQSFRDLALAQSENKQYQEAVDNLYYVVKNVWDGRFPDIELIALNEMNKILSTSPGVINTAGIDNRLIRNLPVDIRIILTWDADNTDMDLWITDPFGEKCFYSHNLTYIGGIISRDFTRGYGPEEFLLKKAQPGKYKVEVNYYGNTQQVLAGATTVQLNLTTGFGTANEKNQSITLRLKDKREVINVGEFEFK